MQMTTPVIGITLDFVPEPKEYDYSSNPYSALRSDYYKSIESSGGIPLLLPITDKDVIIRYYANMIDGLIIPGGDYDIDPSWYGEKNICSRLNNIRFEFEKKLLKAVIKLKKPILGICAGQQLMAVESGGKLFQDIVKQCPNSILHKRLSNNSIDLLTHDISVAPNSLLSSITGLNKFTVNSNHMQAVASVGDNVLVSARAPDGVIEAIEYLNYPFALGVEWHPEYLKTEEDIKIFNSFIEAAKNSR